MGLQIKSPYPLLSKLSSEDKSDGDVENKQAEIEIEDDFCRVSEQEININDDRRLAKAP